MASTTLPSTMRALLHNQKTQTLNIDTTPIPTPSLLQYIIRSHAVALTSGELLWPRPENLTISTPGIDFVGEVVKTPHAGAKFQVGDKVYARVLYPQPGGAREYTVSDDNELALCPKNFFVEEAATVPVSALTAWQALFEQFKLTPPAVGPATGNTTTTASNGTHEKQRILITNGSGGVGIWAVQLAKLAGLHVTATTSTKNIDFVRSLGADEILDYRNTNIRTWAEEDSSRKVDLVLDCIGLTSLEQAWHAVKPNGQVLTIVPPADMQWKWDLDRPEGVDGSVTGRFFVMHPSGNQLGEITKLAEQGKVKAVVDSVYPFDEFEKAFERLASGRTRGKVVLRVSDN